MSSPETCYYFRVSPRFKDTLAPGTDWSSYCIMIAFTCLIYKSGTDDAGRNSGRKLFKRVYASISKVVNDYAGWQNSS